MLAQRCLKVCLLGLLVARAPPALGEVYKWIGADGVTYYSESQPDLPDAVVEMLELLPQAAPEPDAPGYRAALEVARDIEASRLQRERLRLERQKLRFEQAQATARAQREEAPVRHYYPLYPYHYRYPHKPPGKPGHYPYRPPRHWSDMRHDPMPRGGGYARVPGMETR